MMTMNSPCASLVFSSRKVPMSGLVMTTFTPGTGVPAPSTTVPMRRPWPMAWATVVTAARSSRKSAQDSEWRRGRCIDEASVVGWRDARRQRAVTLVPPRRRTLFLPWSRRLSTTHGPKTMKLAGGLAAFSLADLVQVAGLAGRTCGIKILAAEGNGTLFLEGGEVVGAIYEDLAGFDAFVALRTSPAGHSQVENGATAPERNLQGNVQRLLLEANSRIEAGEVPRPRRKAM